MKVVARQNVRDASGWHLKGQVFETEENLGAAVEVLDGPKPAPEAKEREPKAAEPESAPEKAPEKPRSTSRRRSGR